MKIDFFLWFGNSAESHFSRKIGTYTPFNAQFNLYSRNSRQLRDRAVLSTINDFYFMWYVVYSCQSTIGAKNQHIVGSLL